MNRAVRIIFEVLESPLFVTVNIAGALTFTLWLTSSRFNNQVNYYQILGLLALVLVIFLTYVYSIKVRAENIALKNIAEEFYEINQIYRQKINELYGGDRQREIGELVAEEMLTLKAVCQRISHIYERVINRKCTVTIKLVTIECGECFAHTYVRSEDLCARDIGGRIRYKIEENTGFDEALRIRSDGRPAHFYSSDLKKETNYKNQRDYYSLYYRSTLLVPIGDMVIAQDGERLIDGLVGFLCVDTLSVNRLNNRYHLYMLSALSSQMYTFISFLRGKYMISKET